MITSQLGEKKWKEGRLKKKERKEGRKTDVKEEGWGG